MRYLVIGEATGGASAMPPQQAAQILDAVVVPSLEMLAKWEREGRINGGSFAGRRGGCMIIDAPGGILAAGRRACAPKRRCVKPDCFPCHDANLVRHHRERRSGARAHEDARTQSRHCTAPSDGCR